MEYLKLITVAYIPTLLATFVSYLLTKDVQLAIKVAAASLVVPLSVFIVLYFLIGNNSRLGIIFRLGKERIKIIDKELKLLNQAKVSITMLGFSLRTYFSHQDDFVTILKNKLQEGVKIKILLVDPGSEYVVERAERERESPKSFIDHINGSMESFKNINKNEINKIKIFTYKSSPVWNLIIIDNSACLISPYPQRKYGGASPCYHIRSRFFKPLIEAFKLHCEYLENTNPSVN